MKNVIILIIFSFGLSLYGGSDLFPFGINNTVYSDFETSTKRENYKRTIDSAATLGIKWWRGMNKFTWLSVQPDDSVDYDWENADSLVMWTGKRGMHILPVIGYMYPVWAHHDSVPDTNTEACKKYPFDPSHWKEYTNFIEAMVDRYNGDGDANDMPGLDTLIPIKYWECMNEPYCSKTFWGTKNQYIEIFDSTRAALKRADPEAKLGGPCLNSKYSNRPWYYYSTRDKSLKCIDYPSYLTLLEDIFYSVDDIDFITHHIYHYNSEGPDTTMEDIRDIRNIVGSSIPIWITECGYQWYQWYHRYTGTDAIFDDRYSFYDDYYPNGGKIWIGDAAYIYWVDSVNTYWNKYTQADEYSELLDSVRRLLDDEENYKFFFFNINALTLGLKIDPFKIIDSIYNDPIWTIVTDSFSVQDPLWEPHTSRPLSIIRGNYKPLPAFYEIRNNVIPRITMYFDESVNTGEIKTYQTRTEIFADNATINNGGKVAMEAGLQIYLGDGFKVEEGGSFYAATNPLYRYGGGSSSTKSIPIPKNAKTSEKSVSEKEKVPKVFSCAQNFPNPFASSTLIKYGLPKDVNVKLEIFNLAGQKIHTLIDKKQTAGYKQISWNGTTGSGARLPQGVYFYTLKADDEFEKKYKMILLK